MAIKQTPPPLVIPSTPSRPRPAGGNATRPEKPASPITDSGIRQAAQDRVQLLESRIEASAGSDKERVGLVNERSVLLEGLAANYG